MSLPLPIDPERSGARGFEACQVLIAWSPIQALAVITDPNQDDEEPYTWIRNQDNVTLEDIKRLIPDEHFCLAPYDFPRYYNLLLPLVGEIGTWEAITRREYITVLVWQTGDDTVACFTLNGKPSDDIEAARDYTLSQIEKHLCQ